MVTSPVYIFEVTAVYKRMFIFVVTIAILLGTGLFAKPQSVFACSCATSQDPEQQVKDELEHSSAVFAGTVTQVKQPRQRIFMSSADLVKVYFEVSRVWKGEVGRQTIVVTAMSSASCGVEDFQTGTEYIVSAYKNSNSLETTICNVTKPISSAEAELIVLGEGYAPTNQALGTGNHSGISLLVIAATILFGSAIVMLIIKRNKSAG